MNDKSYLVDVPVRMNIWIRPECQKRQFEVIKKARPSILFVQSDGGRNEQEWKAIYQNRELVDSGIDWECTIYRFYEDHNNGLYAMGKKVSSFIWKTVDRCIFLEDDYVPAVSFFRYCAELLEKYKDDTRIECICGMNHLGVSEEVSSDYFFSNQGSIWGTATWKRVVDLRKDGLNYYNDQYVMSLLKEKTKKNRIAWKRIQGYGKDGFFEGHVPGSEFWKEFDIYSQGMFQIIPKRNMINNIGCDTNSVHFSQYEMMPKGLRPLFNMKTYEMEFPMKHPQYVTPDPFYEKKRNRILAYNMPLVQRYRIVETLIYKMKYQGFWKTFKHLFRKREKHIEK